MPKIADFLVQNSEPQDDVLHRTLFPVNLRLLRTNRKYKLLIRHAVGYMLEVVGMKFTDYTTLLGLSGANVGIPFNIIVVILPGSKKPTVMLNPTIICASGEVRNVKSNCGSLNLKEPIDVERFKEVIVEYNDMQGELHTRKYKTGTIQHEIDHNNGQLIIDTEPKV